MSNFAKGVFSLAAGNTIAQLISIVAIPIITRLYSPEAYGIFSFFFSAVMIITPLATLHYHTAIMLPDTRVKASNLFALSLVGILGTGLFLTLLAAITPRKWFLEMGNAHDIDILLWLFPIAVVSQSIVLTISFWVVRLKRFKDASISRIVEASTDRVSGIILGLTGSGALGLVVSRLAGAALSIYYVFFRAASRKNDIRPVRQEMSIDGIKGVGRQYIHFPIYSIVATLLNVTSREAPTLLLAVIFSSTVTGMFALAMRIINMPMSVVGDAISRAYYQRASELNATGQPIKNITLQLFTYMLYFGVPPVIFLICFSNQLFGFIFGVAWQEAGTYTQVLGISFLAMFIQRPLASLFDVFEKQKHKLVFNVLLFTFRTIPIIASAIFYNSPILTIVLLSTATFLVYVSSCAYLFRLANVTLKTAAFKFTHATWPLSASLVGMPIVRYYYQSNIAYELFLSITILLAQLMILMAIDPWLKAHFLKTVRMRRVQ